MSSIHRAKSEFGSLMHSDYSDERIKFMFDLPCKIGTRVSEHLRKVS
jgi:hypothetical protein